MTKKWTSIAVKRNTHDTLADMKEKKDTGLLENFDDVIRRKLKLPEEHGDNP